MILPIFLPPHDFQPVDLPAMPGVSGPRKVYACSRCGLIGHMPEGQMFITVNGTPTPAQLACQAESDDNNAWFARVTCPNLAGRGPQFARYVVGSTHLIIPTPKGETDRMAGVWVEGDVKLVAGEFLPLRMRLRRRPSRLVGRASGARSRVTG